MGIDWDNSAKAFREKANDNFHRFGRHGNFLVLLAAATEELEEVGRGILEEDFEAVKRETADCGAVLLEIFEEAKILLKPAAQLAEGK